MSHYLLSAHDQKYNNWLAHHEGSDSKLQIRDKYADLRCRICGKVDSLVALNRGLDPDFTIRAAAGTDYLLTTDGFVVVSERCKRLIETSGFDGVRFVGPIGDCSMYAVEPLVIANCNVAECGMEFYRLCPSCKRFRETCLAPRVASMQLPESDNTIFMPSVLIENRIGSAMFLFASEGVTRKLRAARLKGLLLKEAY